MTPNNAPSSPPETNATFTATKAQGVAGILGAVVLMLAIGCPYSWSLFVPQLELVYRWSSQESQTVFGIFITVLSLAQLLGSPLASRFSLLHIILGSIALFGTGFGLAAYAAGNFWLTLLGIGLFAGLGVGIIYISLIAFVLQRYQRGAGVLTGLVVSGYALGAAWVSWIYGPLLEAGWDAPAVFGAMALGNSALCLLGLAGLSYAHASIKPAQTVGDGPKKSSVPWELWGASLRDPYFIKLFLSITCGIGAGFIIIGNLKPLSVAYEWPGAMALLVVSVFAMGNALGRVAWGALSDKLGALVSPFSLGASALSLAALPALNLLAVEPWVLMTVIVTVVLLCGANFGANFVIYAYQVKEHYGKEKAAPIYALLLQGQAVAAFLMPALAGWWTDTTGNVVNIIPLAVGLALLGLGIQVFWKPAPSPGLLPDNQLPVTG